MKDDKMKTIKINNILKVLFIIFSALFLLTACSTSEDGATAMSQADPRAAADKQRTCWQSEFISIFYNTIGAQTIKVYTEQTKHNNLFGVVILGFSIWMAFQILRHIAAPAPESLGEFWNKIVRKAFLCAMCGILASSTDQIYYVLQNFIFPIYITILEFTSKILEVTANDPAAQIKAIKIASTFGDDVGESGKGYICEVYANQFQGTGCHFDGKMATNFSSGQFPKEPMEMMGCMACAVSDRLSVGFDVAIRLFKVGNFTAFCVACFLMICFTIVKFGFVFYLVDSIFRLNIILIILPFLIMAYPFEQIRKWSVSGFKIIISSSAIMLCLGLTISMTILAMQKMLTQKDLDFGNSALYEKFGSIAMALIFMGFLIIKATGLAVELSSKISGIQTSADFQKKFKALVATIGKAVLHVFTVGGSKVATTIIDHVERLRQLREKYRKAKAKFDKARARINKLAGRKSPKEGK